MNDVETVKVLFLGDSDVRKSSIINQFKSKALEFKELYKAIEFDLLDAAGREKCKSILKLFFGDSKVIIFVYDVRNSNSFEEIKSYYYNITKSNCDSDAIFVVLGNKYNRYNELQVSEEEGKEFSVSINAIFQLTSCENNTDINNLFDIIGRKYLNQKIEFEKKEEEKKNKPLKEKKECY